MIDFNLLAYYQGKILDGTRNLVEKDLATVGKYALSCFVGLIEWQLVKLACAFIDQEVTFHIYITKGGDINKKSMNKWHMDIKRKCITRNEIIVFHNFPRPTSKFFFKTLKRSGMK